MSYPVMSNRSLRRRQFANDGPTVSPSTTYAGESALPYVAPALKLADTVQKGFVRQIDGIQNKAVISSLSNSTGVIQAANCSWNDKDSMVLGERVLTLSDLSVMEALCRKTLLPTWVGQGGARQTMSAGNPEFQAFAVATIAGYAAQGVENGIWTGGMSTGQKGFLSNDGVFDSAGYNASILGTASVNEVAVAAAGFTIGTATTGILSSAGAFAKAYDEAVADCPAILNRTDVAFYVGTAVAGTYMQALATSGSQQGVNLQSTNQAFDTLQYLGVPIHVCPGMPTQAIVLTYEENLVVGSNLATDFTEAQVIDDWQYSGSDQIKVVMRFGCGVQVAIPGDCVVGALSTVL